jgi:hypothetical protein
MSQHQAMKLLNAREYDIFYHHIEAMRYKLPATTKKVSFGSQTRKNMNRRSPDSQYVEVPKTPDGRTFASIRGSWIAEVKRLYNMLFPAISKTAPEVLRLPEEYRNMEISDNVMHTVYFCCMLKAASLIWVFFFYESTGISLPPGINDENYVTFPSEPGITFIKVDFETIL